MTTMLEPIAFSEPSYSSMKSKKRRRMHSFRSSYFTVCEHRRIGNEKTILDKQKSLTTGQTNCTHESMKQNSVKISGHHIPTIKLSPTELNEHLDSLDEKISEEPKKLKGFSQCVSPRMMEKLRDVKNRTVNLLDKTHSKENAFRQKISSLLSKSSRGKFFNCVYSLHV